MTGDLFFLTVLVALAAWAGAHAWAWLVGRVGEAVLKRWGRM